jgi:glutamine cyclotransferase
MRSQTLVCDLFSFFYVANPYFYKVCWLKFWNFSLYLLENSFVMKSLIIALALSVSIVACGSQPSKSISQPAIVQLVQYTYKVKNTYPHATHCYTQGLQYVDGLMWEGTGEYGSSQVVTYELGQNAPRVELSLPASEFGEGITLLGGEMFQLTWESNVCHVYDVASRKKLRDHRYPGEGWGLTTDGEKLYMSNGTSTIYRVDPKTFQREGRITVTLRGETLNYINELEWIDGKIWANVYTTNYIVIINPETGVVEGMIDCEGLLSDEDITTRTDVLNGIAYDAATKRIFVTGKRWNKLFEIEIVKR